MSVIEVLSRTQRIVVSSNKSVSVINAGPPGPRGWEGLPGSDAVVDEANVEVVIGPRNGVNGYAGLDAEMLLPDILIPVSLSGYVDAIFPPPVPPVDFTGLANPTVAPTLTKSDTADGRLLPGQYSYSYAAWKGTPSQATAPSPSAVITLSAEDTVTLTYPTIPGADGYLVYREEL